MCEIAYSKSPSEEEFNIFDVAASRSFLEHFVFSGALQLSMLCDVQPSHVLQYGQFAPPPPKSASPPPQPAAGGDVDAAGADADAGAAGVGDGEAGAHTAAEAGAGGAADSADVGGAGAAAGTDGDEEGSEEGGADAEAEEGGAEAEEGGADAEAGAEKEPSGHWHDGAPVGRGHRVPYLQMAYEGDIIRGDKSVEGRPDKGWLTQCKVDDFVKFKISKRGPGVPPRTLICRIKKVTRYASFVDMLKVEGVYACLPGFEGA